MGVAQTGDGLPPDILAWEAAAVLCAYASWLKEQRTSPRVAGSSKIGSRTGLNVPRKARRNEDVFLGMAARRG